jgi:SAM-dependent methyltransferase
MTSDWYRAVLSRLPKGARVLDVGIGTGAALARSADLVRAKKLEIVGLDIDPDYLRRCRAELLRAGLAGQVEPVFSSVYDHRGGPYDAVYFSASLMLLPDPAAAIAHVAQLVAPDGRVFATQTFQHRRSPLLERVKPMVRHLTTIQFGRVTYEEEFRRAFAEAGVDLVELVTLRGRRHYSYRLAVARLRDDEERTAA